MYVVNGLTDPQFWEPKETIPRKYLGSLKSPHPPSNDIKGPPESPLHESFPAKIKSKNFKSFLIQNNYTFNNH